MAQTQWVLHFLRGATAAFHGLRIAQMLEAIGEADGPNVPAAARVVAAAARANDQDDVPAADRTNDKNAPAAGQAQEEELGADAIRRQGNADEAFDQKISRPSLVKRILVFISMRATTWAGAALIIKAVIVTLNAGVS